MNSPDHSVSGRAYLRKLKGGDTWYAHLRYYPSRRDRRPKLGPAWKQKTTPPVGYLTKRTAEAALQELLVAERRSLGVAPREGGDHTFQQATDEWLRWTELERGRRANTMSDYRNAVDRVLIPRFGAETLLSAITSKEIEVAKGAWMARLTPRTTNKYLVMLGGIFKRAKRLGWVDANPLERVDRLPQRRNNRFQHLEPEEVEALARAATPANACLYVTAAFTGLRQGELRQLCWDDVDFARHLVHVRRVTKSGYARSVPMIDRVAKELDRLSQRDRFTDTTDLVFPNEVGRSFDPSRVLKQFRRDLAAAGLPRVRFHDLRHTFGTLAVRAPNTPLTTVQAWMGHANIQTTMIYVHYTPQGNAAANLAEAMTSDLVPSVVPLPGQTPDNQADPTPVHNRITEPQPSDSPDS